MVARFTIPLVLSRRRLAVPVSTPTPGAGIVDIIRVTGQSLKWLRPGDVCYGEFQIRNPSTGVLAAPDTAPTIEILCNNVVDEAIDVSIALAATGRYRYQFTVPSSYDAGDFVAAIASATVDELLDVGTLVDTRLVAVDWTSEASGGGVVTGFNTDALSQLAGLSISVQLPSDVTAENGTIELTKGDDYLASINRSFQITLTGTLPDMTGSAHAYLALTSSKRITRVFEIAIVSSSVSSIVLEVELTAAETSQLELGQGVWEPQFETATGHKWSVPSPAANPFILLVDSRPGA